MTINLEIKRNDPSSPWDVEVIAVDNGKEQAVAAAVIPPGGSVTVALWDSRELRFREKLRAKPDNPAQ